MTTPHDLVGVALPEALAHRLGALYGLTDAPASLADLVTAAGTAPPPRPKDLLAPGPSPHRAGQGEAGPA